MSRYSKPDVPEPKPASSPPVRVRFTGRDSYIVVLGLFLGLAVLKFGNPVILEAALPAPKSLAEAWAYAWPPHWSLMLVWLVALPGAWLIYRNGLCWHSHRALWLLPLAWLGWQLVSATHTVYPEMTAFALCQFAGCIICYFLGAMVVGSGRGLRLVLAGLLAAFAFCLVRAVVQYSIEFPQEQKELIEGERTGWTNYAPEVIAELKHDRVIISTNGVDIANPIILKKYAKRRVHGTLVYPNALAGIVLLLWPVTLALAVGSKRHLRPRVRVPTIALTVFLGAGALFGSGSKSGWLIALGMAAVWVFTLDWPRHLKALALVVTLAGGLTVFAVRFHDYFAAGATSVSARLDYWRAGVRIALDHPLFGTGPGTFQRPYAEIKNPQAEMARLAHNDYLEQFSDSGMVGGVVYLAWIALMLATIGRKVWPRPRVESPRPDDATDDPESESLVHFMLFLGLLGWFCQGFSEFELYVPALAWSAFLLTGALVNGAPRHSVRPVE